MDDIFVYSSNYNFCEKVIMTKWNWLQSYTYCNFCYHTRCKWNKLKFISASVQFQLSLLSAFAIKMFTAVCGFKQTITFVNSKGGNEMYVMQQQWKACQRALNERSLLCFIGLFHVSIVKCVSVLFLTCIQRNLNLSIALELWVKKSNMEIINNKVVNYIINK